MPSSDDVIQNELSTGEPKAAGDAISPRRLAGPSDETKSVVPDMAERLVHRRPPLSRRQKVGLTLFFMLAFGGLIGAFVYTQAQPSPRAKRERGLAALERKDANTAIECFTDYIRLRPDDGAGYLLRGRAYELKKQYADAIRDTTEAIRLNPKDAFAYINRAYCWYRLRQYDRALADADRGLKLGANPIDGLQVRGHIFADRDDDASALAEYTNALAIQKSSSLYVSRGIVYARMKRWDRAIMDYRSAIQIDPNAQHGDGLTHLAWLLATCPEDLFRDGKQAVELATRACELSKWKEPGCLESLAAAYAEIGQFVEAVKYQKQCLELPEDDPETFNEVRHRLTLYEQGKPYRDE